MLDMLTILEDIDALEQDLTWEGIHLVLGWNESRRSKLVVLRHNQFCQVILKCNESWYGTQVILGCNESWKVIFGCHQFLRVRKVSLDVMSP